jgi:hypothetical protein
MSAWRIAHTDDTEADAVRLGCPPHCASLGQMNHQAGRGPVRRTNVTRGKMHAPIRFIWWSDQTKGKG